MSFMPEEKHEDILCKHSEIRNKIKDLIVEDLDAEVIHNNKYISITIKSCGEGIRTDFHDGLLHEKTQCTTYFELF